MLFCRILELVKKDSSAYGLNVATLIMLYKGQSIRDARQNFENNKGQGLALSHIARDKKAWNRLGIGKGR